MHDLPSRRDGLEWCISSKVDLAGAAHLELVSGVAQLRPEDAMVEAMLRGWRAQQAARGLREETIEPRERLVRRFVAFTNEYPWRWTPAHVDEWSLSLTGERHLAPSTIRSYQCDLRLFTEYVTDNARYGWARRASRVRRATRCRSARVELDRAPNAYEGNPEARAFTREELQRFFDYADDQVERAVQRRSGRAR